jgi:hypothetical protein
MVLDVIGVMVVMMEEEEEEEEEEQDQKFHKGVSKNIFTKIVLIPCSALDVEGSDRL